MNQKFHNASRMRDYGKSIVWPKPPLKGIEEPLRKVYQRLVFMSTLNHGNLLFTSQ